MSKIKMQMKLKWQSSMFSITSHLAACLPQAGILVFELSLIGKDIICL